MKLSDKDLHYALWCAENHTGNSLYTEAMADLEDGTLEIEGYIREDHFADASKMVDEWVKFDPDDPKTFPPCSAPVFGEPAFYFVRINGQTQIAEWDNDYVAFLIDDHEAITHWQPLQEPPKETEEGK